MDIVERYLWVNAVNMIILSTGEVRVFNLDGAKFYVEISLVVVFKMCIEDLHITCVLQWDSFSWRAQSLVITEEDIIMNRKTALWKRAENSLIESPHVADNRVLAKFEVWSKEHWEKAAVELFNI